jgi:hypothetical protein
MTQTKKVNKNNNANRKIQFVLVLLPCSAAIHPSQNIDLWKKLLCWNTNKFKMTQIILEKS